MFVEDSEPAIIRLVFVIFVLFVLFYFYLILNLLSSYCMSILINLLLSGNY